MLKSDPSMSESILTVWEGNPTLEIVANFAMGKREAKG
jgi:hypothetical protein